MASELRDAMKACGMRRSYINNQVLMLDEHWDAANSTLVEEKRTRTHMLWVESLLDRADVPKARLTLDTAGEDLDAWNATMRRVAPRMVHCAKMIAAMDDPAARGIRICFDPAAVAHGSVAALMPLDATHLYPAIKDLVCVSSKEISDSAHAQIEAAGEIHWRFEEAWVLPDVLTGARSPLARIVH
ncbi:hypothetical protein ACOI1H_19975 [Loktanella sp. DJP18]|uniref:hypothetical protein n=1 Tax=Loktanella sp. DJP18 TaxID=3409788 RepID=UPI003BB6DA79